MKGSNHSSPAKAARVLSLLCLCLLALALLASNASAVADANPPIQYDTVMTRYYTSSVDGATLPCSVYVPQTAVMMPVWVDLHAFGGHGGISEEMADAARAYGCIVVSPWGRNYHSFFMDGKDKAGAPEPRLVDDFTAGSAAGWSALIGDRWTAQSDSYQQLDPSDAWKLAGRAGSSGSYCSASVDMTAFEPSTADGYGEYAGGLMVRRQPNGDGYLVDLDCDPAGKKWVRIFKRGGSQWTTLSRTSLPDAVDLQATHNLKVVLYEDTIEVHGDHYVMASAQDASFASGEVALASFGAKHRFDDFRLQNETLYGERDVMDTVDQCLEELGGTLALADSSRMFIAGQSMGGLGALNLGLHYPDLFAYIHPAWGPSDLSEGYDWIKAQYPDQDPSTPVGGRYYAREQDGNIGEAIRALHGGVEPGAGGAPVASNLHENSARYILENALNTPVRFEHPEYDSLVPNTTSPMTIKWLNTGGDWIKVKDGDQRPSAPYASGKGLWQTWAGTSGLYNCAPETSLYDPSTGAPGPSVPTLGIWDNTDYSAMLDYGYGSHCGVVGDSSLAAPVLLSFLRLNSQYGTLHADPDDVAYRTFDSKHGRAWWLTLEPAYPDQDKPGLARAHRDIAANRINLHVKNGKTTTLDLVRMRMNTTSGVLTVTVDSNTSPESEFKVSDEYRKTDLRLTGAWFPARKGDYQVRLDGSAVGFEMTGTTLTVPGIDTASGTRTFTVTMPSGLDGLNLLAARNPGFESGTGGWSPAMDGGLNGVFELNQQPFLSHSGSNSIVIKNPVAGAAPYTGYWQSGTIPVQPLKVYDLSAFAKTRAFNSVERSYLDGIYAPGTGSWAAVGLMWQRADGTLAGWDNSAGINDSTGWTPIEVSAPAPADAAMVRAVLFTVCPNSGGISGSAWFDDVSLTTESAMAVTSVSPASAANTAAVDLSVGGTGFKSGAAVRLERGATIIGATAVTVTSSTTITCQVNISGQPLGKYDVVVTNPDGQEARLVGGFSVTDACGQGAAASISVFAGVLGLLSLAGSTRLLRRKNL